MDLFDKCRVEIVEKATAENVYPYFHQIESKQAPEVIMEGSRRIMLGSNNYLGLTSNPDVIAAGVRALEKYGSGCSGSRFLNGTLDLHVQLESELADFLNKEDVMTFSTGFQSNLGIISAIAGRGDYIFCDKENHASIYDGCKLSYAKTIRFNHSDMAHLETALQSVPLESGKLIVTDGVFSMGGDICKLPEIVELAQKYKARVMVDDAHGVGVVGKTGRGTAEYFGVTGKIDLNVGMLSKGPGGLGGYCAASRKVVQYLRLYARSYFFSTALPASVAGGLNEVFKLLASDNAGREKLWENINYLKLKLSEKGFDIGNSQSAVIPVMIYSEPVLFELYDKLRRNGVYVNIVTYPAVRRKECRMRLCAMKDLNFEQIERAVDIIAKYAREYNVIS